MITESTERRWRVAISGNERGSDVDLLVVNSIDGVDLLVVNSIDGDKKSVKVTLGVCEKIVPVVDLIDLLRRVAANTDGIPAELCP